MVNLKIVCDMCNKQEDCKHLPYCLLSEEQLDEKTSILQNKLKALDEILEKGNKFYELCTPCCTMNYTKFGVLVYDILEKYNLVKQEENV